MLGIKEPIVEAFVGEYASGKSEIAVNRALKLLDLGREVTLVDLDLVEPFYTLRPIKKKLIARGLDVIAWETEQTLGLGEAGAILKPEMKWALYRPGDIILDIGYGVEGAKTLNLIEGAEDNRYLRIYVVLNIGRPMTATFSDIMAYLKTLGKIHGLINNSHLGDDTDIEIIQAGAKIITKAAGMLNIPVIATSIDEKFAEKIGAKDCQGNPIWLLKRYMINTYW